MFSLQRWFSNSAEFYDLLTAAAEESNDSIRELRNVLTSPPPDGRIDKLGDHRRKQKRIRDKLSELLCTSFSTPIEREDIEELATALYKIPKTVERFSERLMICPPHIKGDYLRQAGLAEEAAKTVSEMVRDLRRQGNIEKMRDLNDKLQSLEAEGDKAMLEILKELYGGKHDALTVVILRNFYETLEKIIDRCRTAGNIVYHIVLKYS